MTNPYFAQALVAAERAARNGMPISPESLCSEDPELPVSAAMELLAEQRFADALEELGVNFTPMQRITSQQIAAIHLYLAAGNRTHQAKLRAAGVSATKWAGWMRQPLFADYISQHALDRLHGALPAAHMALADKAGAGESWAVSLLYQITGFHDPSKVDDPRKYFEAIFEVLSDEGVSDEILNKLAARIRQLSDPNTAASSARPAMIALSTPRAQEAS